LSSDGEQVEPLACPTCARKYSLDERFCSECRMPLVYVGRDDEQPITEAHERARKVRPEYTEGELVKATMAGNLAEAELIQGLLLEEGIPSILRRTRGFDVPDFLAAGPRDVLVPQTALAAARELLTDVGADGDQGLDPAAGEQRPLTLALGMLAALVLAALLVYVLFEVVA
jgi:hypothetical protein